jgi:DUF1016 N-terminal domain
MRQFFDAYKGQEKVSALLTQLPWTHNLLILGKCKREVEREFYLRLACGQKWSSRELERQINSALFERVVLSPAKLAAPLRVLKPRQRRQRCLPCRVPRPFAPTVRSRPAVTQAERLKQYNLLASASPPKRSLRCGSDQR